MELVSYEQFEKDINDFTEGKTLQSYCDVKESKSICEGGEISYYSKYIKEEKVLEIIKKTIDIGHQVLCPIIPHRRGGNVKIKGELQIIDYKINGKERKTWKISSLSRCP